MYDNQPDDRLLDGLNDRQNEAVTMDDTDVIILAGAGSGKTRVLTTRLAWLLRQGRAQPKEVLAVTFTNKASKEMKDRLTKMVSVPVGSMWIGTFHGLCHRMLRENARIAGLPVGFSIMDEDDQSAMIKRMMKEMQNVPEDIKPKDVQNFINKCKEQGIRASSCVPASMLEDFAVPFYAAYESRCARQGTIDFAELQLRTSELLQTNQEFLDRYQNRFSHILVDEFQDTNLIQYNWLKTLRGDRASVFAVGDDDQSIYGFRGSNPQNMTDFVNEIANGKIVRLEQNYRSTGNILAAANALIDNNTGRLGKDLWTDAGNGTRTRILAFARDLEESDQVGTEIKNWLNKGQDPSQIAILYRANHQSRAYEKALMARGIPYVIYGGTRFFERMEIKNVLAYLKLTINFKDDVAFRRVVNFPPRGLGDVTIDKIAEVAKNNLDENSEPLSLLQAAATVYDGKGKDKIDNFVSLILDLLENSQKMNLPDFMQYTIEVTGLKEAYLKNAEDEDRARNLGELLTAAKSFCEETEIEQASSRPASDILNEFLASASLESALDRGNSGTEDLKGKEDVKAVTLMTVHSAKGLEFENVIIGGAEEGIFPSEKSTKEGSDEEERRLMYVAITRARKNLIITHAKYRVVYGEKNEFDPSRFLIEIPANLKEQYRFPSPFWNQNNSGKDNSAKEKTSTVSAAKPIAVPNHPLKTNVSITQMDPAHADDLTKKEVTQNLPIPSQETTPMPTEKQALQDEIAVSESASEQSASKRLMFRRR